MESSDWIQHIQSISKASNCIYAIYLLRWWAGRTLQQNTRVLHAHSRYLSDDWCMQWFWLTVVIFIMFWSPLVGRPWLESRNQGDELESILILSWGSTTLNLPVACTRRGPGGVPVYSRGLQEDCILNLSANKTSRNFGYMEWRSLRTNKCTDHNCLNISRWGWTEGELELRLGEVRQTLVAVSSHESGELWLSMNRWRTFFMTRNIRWTTDELVSWLWLSV